MSPDFSKNFAADPSLKSVKGGGQHMEEGTPPSPSTTKRDIRYFLSVLLFALALVATGGMVGVNLYFDREISFIEDSIDSLKEGIKANDIAELALFDRQVQTLKNITFSRGGYSLLLDEVSKLVVPRAHYTSVSMSFAGNDTYALVVKGSADSYEAYLQQIQKFEVAEGLLEGIRPGSHSFRQDKEGNTIVFFTVNFEVPIAKVTDILTEPS